MPRTMTADELRAFLEHGTRTAKLAVVRKDGRPYVAPVWFVLDGEELVFSSAGGTIKSHALRRDPRVCLVVDDDHPPFAWARVEGEASISEDPGELRAWATRIGGRYMGADRAEEFGARNGVPGELLVRVRPTRITGEADIAGR